MSTKPNQSVPANEDDDFKPDFSKPIGLADLGAVFGIFRAPVAEILQRVEQDSENRRTHTVDSIQHSINRSEIAALTKEYDSAIDAEKEDDEPVASALVPASAPAITKPTAKKVEPKENFVAASAPVPVDTTPLPDLTNAYLDQLIGWYRQKEGVNPRANALHVWIKDEFEQWHKSPRESWAAINQALTNRERNVETPATNLVEHIKSTRLNLTQERLEQLLDWYKEKTGKAHKKLQDVWVKDTGEWELAPYRWSEIEREFIYPEVRAALGAETLQDYKRQRVTEAIDRLVLAQGPLPAARLG